MEHEFELRSSLGRIWERFSSRTSREWIVVGLLRQDRSSRTFESRKIRKLTRTFGETRNVIISDSVWCVEVACKETEENILRRFDIILRRVSTSYYA